MTLNGKQIIAAREKNRFTKLKRFLLFSVIVCLIFLVACFVLVVSLIFVGRGDWDYNISGDYELVRVNSKEIVLCRKLDEISGSLVIENCYVEAFINNDSFIAVRGIDMPGHAVTQEALLSEERVYYLVDMKTGEIIFNCDDLNSFVVFCTDKDIFDNMEWINSLDCSPYRYQN